MFYHGRKGQFQRHKGLSIYYVIRDEGGGLPDLLQYYIGGGLPNLLQYYMGGGLESLLQYYSFEMKMEGYNPCSALKNQKVNRLQF